MDSNHNEAGLEVTQAHFPTSQMDDSGSSIVSEPGEGVNTFLGAALGYAGPGLRAFPVAEGGREPKIAGGHGCKDATTDEAVIRDRWSRWPNANTGLATDDGLVVLDIDPRNGGDDSINELELQFGLLPETVESRTGGGGRHLFSRDPRGAAAQEPGRGPPLCGHQGRRRVCRRFSVSPPERSALHLARSPR